MWSYMSWECVDMHIIVLMHCASCRKPFHFPHHQINTDSLLLNDSWSCHVNNAGNLHTR